LAKSPHNFVVKTICVAFEFGMRLDVDLLMHPQATGRGHAEAKQECTQRHGEPGA
jgi:hypothetical protein